MSLLPPPSPLPLSQDRPKYGARQHITCVADTTSNARGDHTFSGLVFPLHVKSSSPFDELQIQSLDIRGGLGPISVYFSDESLTDCFKDVSKWRCIYGPVLHAPSWSEPVPLVFDSPLLLKPKSRCTLYVHSTAPGDQAIVYDNAVSGVCYEDDFIQLLAGLAHVSNEPFGLNSPWGGTAWRSRRCFVGRVQYSYKPVLWSPQTHQRFPLGFQRTAVFLLAMHRRGDSSVFSRSCNRDVISHILSFLAWNDFPDPLKSRSSNLVLADFGDLSAYARALRSCPRFVQRAALLLFDVFQSLVHSREDGR